MNKIYKLAVLLLCLVAVFSAPCFSATVNQSEHAGAVPAEPVFKIDGKNADQMYIPLLEKHNKRTGQNLTLREFKEYLEKRREAGLVNEISVAVFVSIDPEGIPVSRFASMKPEERFREVIQIYEHSQEVKPYGAAGNFDSDYPPVSEGDLVLNLSQKAMISCGYASDVQKTVKCTIKAHINGQHHRKGKKADIDRKFDKSLEIPIGQWVLVEFQPPLEKNSERCENIFVLVRILPAWQNDK